MELRFRDETPIEPTTPLDAPLFNVPHAPAQHFVGRDDLLNDLRDQLASDDPTKHVQAIHGLSGVGKTRLAIEYAHRYRDQYKIVWWVRAEEGASVWIDFAALARALRLPVSADAYLDTVREHLRRYLATRHDWLLIFDNAANARMIREFLPENCPGHVIITSRSSNWQGAARSFPIHGLARADSVHFMRVRTGRIDSETSARRLAQALGDLPLALEQAAALIARSRISFDQYLRKFEERWGKSFVSHAPGGADWPDSVALTWELSFQQLETDNPGAIALLNLLCFLAPDGIPRQLLLDHFERLPDPLTQLASSATSLDRALNALKQFSLVESADGSLSVHRLVGALARHRLSEDERRFYATAVARLTSEAFGFDSADPSSWARAGKILPHALAAADHAQSTGAPVEVTCELIDKAGRYLHRVARYDQAKALFDRALALSRRAYGDESPKVSAIANNLARVMARLGQTEYAQQHYEWALAIDRNTYGDDDPHVATIMNNYGLVLHAAGELDSAKSHFESALVIFEQHYGPDHPKVATLLNNLGYIHLKAGDVQSAHDLFHRALSIARATLGESHPTIAAIFHNLGMSHLRAGQKLLATEALERALAIDVAAYGENHPDVLRDCNALIALANELGDSVMAGDFAARAGRIRANLAKEPEPVNMEP